MMLNAPSEAEAEDEVESNRRVQIASVDRCTSKTTVRFLGRGVLGGVCRVWIVRNAA